MSNADPIEQRDSNTGAALEPVPPPWERRRRAAFRWLDRRARRLVYGTALDWHTRRDVRAFREEDAQANLESSPPDDERVRVHCIWAVEFFGPTEQAQLLASIKRLDWDRHDRWYGDVSEWVRESRSGTGGGWLNLGTITRRGDRRWMGDKRYTDLPSAFDSALGSVVSMSSSLTAVVMQFSLRDEPRGRLDRALRATYQTYASRTEQGIRFHPPADQKRKAASQVLDGYRQQAASWFRTELPGVFAGGLLGPHFPTCIFLTTDRARPFDDTARASFNTYMQILGLGHEWDVWSSQDLEGLTLHFSRYDTSPALNLIIAGRADQVFTKERGEGAGGDSEWGTVYRLSLDFTHSVTYLAIESLLRGYDARLAELRDALRSLADREDERSLRRVRREILAVGGDIQPVASDLIHWLLPRWRAGIDFTPAPSSPEPDKGRKLLDSRSKYFHERAERLMATQAWLRDVLSAAAGLSASTVALRLGRLSLFVSLIATAAAVTAVLGTWMGAAR
jgi:hypothetical protein